MDAKSIEATRAAQGVLASARADLKVDGHWGSFTEGAFKAASPSIQRAVIAALGAYNVTPGQLKAAFDQERVSPARGDAEKARAVIERGGGDTRDEVNKAVAYASKVTAIPVNQLATVVQIESRGNPMAVNGKSKGLFQVQPGAWDESAEWLRKRGVDIGTWSSNVFKPEQNALAGAAYMKINMDRLKALGYTGPLTPAVLYLAHQQGAGGFVELWRANQGLGPVKKPLVTEEAMKGNPPQDGKGVTTDKAEFYRRWMAVAEKKFA